MLKKVIFARWRTIRIVGVWPHGHRVFNSIRGHSITCNKSGSIWCLPNEQAGGALIITSSRHDICTILTLFPLLCFFHSVCSTLKQHSLRPSAFPAPHPCTWPCTPFFPASPSLSPLHPVLRFCASIDIILFITSTCQERTQETSPNHPTFFIQMTHFFAKRKGKNKSLEVTLQWCGCPAGSLCKIAGCCGADFFLFFLKC